MRNTKLILISLLSMYIMVMQAQSKVIAIRLSNDAVTRIAVEDLQKITFDENSMRLHLKSGDVSGISLGEIRYFSFEALTGINPAVANAASWTVFPSVVKDQLAFKSLGEGPHNVAVYSLSGQLVLQQRIENADVVLQMNHLQPGLYVVRIENRAIKFIKE